MQLSLFEEDPQIAADNRVNILLAIQNEYFQKILNGTKKYEYRLKFPQKAVRAYIYVPKKVKAIKGYVDLAPPIMGSAEKISLIFADCGDGDYESMFNYIGKGKNACAMRIEDIVVFDRPIYYTTIKMEFPHFSAPQSYMLLDREPVLLRYIAGMNNGTHSNSLFKEVTS